MTEDSLTLGTDNEARLERLRDVLIASQGFELIVVAIEADQARDEVVRRLQHWSGRDGVPVLELVALKAGESVTAAIGLRDAGIIVVGLDPHRRDDEAAPDMIAELNWQRDSFPAAINGPMILIVDHATQVALFDRAPDLYSWRRHTVAIDAPRASATRSIARITPRRATEERQRLEAMLEQIATRPTPPAVHLRLLDRLAELKLDSRNIARAESLIAQGTALISKGGVAADAIAPHHLVAAQVALSAQDIDRATRELAHAEQMRGGRDDEHLDARFLRTRGNLARRRDDFTSATAYFDQAATAFARAGDRWSSASMAIEALFMVWLRGDDGSGRLDDVLALLRDGDPEARYPLLEHLAARSLMAPRRDRRRIGDALRQCAEAWGDREAVHVARLVHDVLDR